MTDGPGSSADSPADAERGFSWGRVLVLFSPHRWRVAGVVALVIVTAALGVVNPLLTQTVFDRALFPADSDGVQVRLLVVLVSVMLAVTLLGGVFGVWQTVVTNRLGQNVLLTLRNDLFSHLQSLSLRFYGSARTGDLQSRLSSDVGGVQTAVTTTMSSILSNAVSLIAAGVAMVALSRQLALLTVLVVPLFVVATRAIGTRRERFTGEAQRATAEMSTVTQEALSASGITLAKLFGRQEHESDRFRTANAQLSTAAGRQQIIGQGFFTVVQTFLGAMPVIVYLVAGLLIVSGNDLSVGTVVAFTTLQTRVFFPVARMLETVVELQSSRALFKRIFAYLDVEPDIVEAEKPTRISTDAVRGVVAFDAVHFGYTVGEPVLRGIDFVAQPGQLIAFVGRQGQESRPSSNSWPASMTPRAARSPWTGTTYATSRSIRSPTLSGMVTPGVVPLRRNPTRQHRLWRPGCL